MIRRLSATMTGVSGCLAAFLVACGDKGSAAGGGGFGGETVSGVVVDLAGAPVPRARIDLRASRSWEGTVLATASTDAQGRFAFDKTPSFPVRLEVAAEVGADSLRAVLDLEPGQGVLGRIAAQASPARRVRLVSASGVPIAATIFAYGLGRSAASDDSGYVRLDAWPLADAWVRVVPSGGGDASDLLIPRSAAGDLVLEPGWLVDDFESALIRTRLGLLVGGGWWYAVAVGEDSARYVSPLTRDIVELRDTGVSHGGRGSLHARFALRPDSVWGYGLVGFRFGATRNLSVDLDGMDSLVFWTRGSGSVRAEIVAVDGQDTAHYAKTFSPGPEWGRVVVRATELLPVETGVGPWSAASKRAILLQFIVFDSAEFWIDDLRFFGTYLPG